MSVLSLIQTGSVLLKCHPEDALQTVATLMSLNRVSALPVLDHEGDLIGVVAVWDIMTSFANVGELVAEQKVRDIMTRSVITCAPDISPSQAIALMNVHKISNIVVCNGGDVMGTLSSRDVLRALHDQEALEINVLKDIAIAARH